MNPKKQKFKNWYSENKEIFDFIGILCGVVIAIGTLILAIPLIRDALKNIQITASWFSKILQVLIFIVPAPLIVILLIAVAFMWYLSRVRKKYPKIIFKTSHLIGTWKNEWSGVHTGSEVFQFTRDGQYLRDGVNIFKIEDFEFNSQKKEIKFIKVSLRQNDNRRLLNILKIINDSLLEGTEANYNIKYTKIAD